MKVENIPHNCSLQNIAFPLPLFWSFGVIGKVSVPEVKQRTLIFLRPTVQIPFRFDDTVQKSCKNISFNETCRPTFKLGKGQTLEAARLESVKLKTKTFVQCVQNLETIGL
jgi:hypothetical protein